MSTPNETRCFTCRQLVREPPVLNELADGSSCPACRNRVLDSLPSLLPSSPVEVEVEVEEDEEDDGDGGPRSLVLVEDEVAATDEPPRPA